MIHPRSLYTSGESKPESPLLALSHQISRLLFLYKKERISPLVERKQHEHHPPHYHRIAHSRSKIIPL